MTKFSLTITGNTWAELLANAANIAALSDDDDASDDEGASVADPSAPAVFDSAGIPWDARIHSSNKQTKEDGTWRKRKNLAPGVFDKVMAELRANTAGSAPSAPPAPPVAPADIQAGVNAVTASTPAPFVPNPNVTIPPAPAFVPPAPPVAPPPPVAGMGFAEFMPKLSAAMQAGRFDAAALAGYLNQWQLSEIGQLANDPAKTLQFYEWLKSAGLVD